MNNPVRMLIGVVIIASYLAPPAVLLAYGCYSGAINGWGDALGSTVRLLAASIASVAFGVAAADKLPLLRKVDGARFYFSFFPLYVAVFLTICFFLAIEIQFSDEHRIGRYSY